MNRQTFEAYSIRLKHEKDLYIYSTTQECLSCLLVSLKVDRRFEREERKERNGNRSHMKFHRKRNVTRVNEQGGTASAVVNGSRWSSRGEVSRTPRASKIIRERSASGHT